MERDKKAMEKRHAVRVNQLIQETMAARLNGSWFILKIAMIFREETVSLTARVRELEAEMNKVRTDTGTMTDPLVS